MHRPLRKTRFDEITDVERPASDTDAEPKSLSRSNEKKLRAALLERDTAAIQARQTTIHLNRRFGITFNTKLGAFRKITAIGISLDGRGRLRDRGSLVHQ